VEIVGLDVDEMAFDLDEAVIAEIPVHGQCPAVPVLTGFGRWERHRSLHVRVTL
jgi:hypothetical protein